MKHVSSELLDERLALSRRALDARISRLDGVKARVGHNFLHGRCVWRSV